MTILARTRLGAMLMGTAAAAVMLGAPAVAAAQDHVQSFDIPAEDGAQALNDFARQAGVQIVFPYDSAHGRAAPSVRGKFTRRQAAGRLAAALGLEVTSDQNGVITLRALGEAVTAAGRQADTTPVIEEVVVTGTNIPGARSASPIDVFGRDRIDQSGYTTTQQFVASLPQNWGGGVTALTVNAQVSQSTTGLPGDSAANIHGLGPRATLTLVDGHRLAPSGLGQYVDLSTIPLSAVERVEVLTDGASALYGSDAVGGVLNLIMRKHLSGLETVVDYGGVTDGGMRQRTFSQSAGADWGSGSGLLAYDYSDASALASADRKFTPPSVAGSDLVPGSTTQSLFGTVNQAVGGDLSLYGTGLYSHKSSTTTDVLFGQSDLRAESASIFGGAKYQLNPAWTIDLSGTWSRNKVSALQAGAFGVSSDYDERSEAKSVNLLVNGELFALPAGVVKAALGAERRDETFGMVNHLSGTDLELGRNASALFGEFYLPVFSDENRRPLLEELTFTAAGRFEHYSDFGSTTNPKFGVRWKPVADLLLRATDGTSFNAPTLLDNAGVSQGIPFPLADPAAPGGTTIALVMLGVKSGLQPETSRTKTLGADYQPAAIPGLKASVTYFETRYNGKIQAPAPNFIGMLVNASQYGDLITRNPTAQQVTDTIAGIDQFFNPFGFPLSSITAIVDDRVQNIGVVDVRGWDFSLAYSRPMLSGEMAANLSGEHLDRFAQQLTPAATPVNVANTVYNPPSWKLRGDLSWRKGGFGLAGTVNYVGSYVNNLVSPTQPVGAFTTADLQASYQFPSTSQPFSGLSLSLSVLNVFNAQPPGVAGSLSGYDPTNASPLGRFVTFQLRKRW